MEILKIDALITSGEVFQESEGILILTWLISIPDFRYDESPPLTGRGVSGRSERSLAEGMTRLIRRWRRRTVGPYAAAGAASRAIPIDSHATTHDDLIEATPVLDADQIAAVPVHGVVVARRQ